MTLKTATEQILDKLNAAMEEKNSHLMAPEKQQQESLCIIQSAISELPESFQQRIHQEFFDAGPLEDLIKDMDISEIMISSESIHFEKNGCLHFHKDHFLTPFTFHQFLNRLFDEIQCHPTLKKPFTDGSWRGFRVHAIRSPISNSEFQLTLRRHSGTRWSLSDLVDHNVMPEILSFQLKKSFEQKKNILIVGPTGCGKTTLINALLQSTDTLQRFLILEDTDELALPNEVSVKLLTRQKNIDTLDEIDQQMLLHQSLRMRPDRIVMGEVRGPEARDLLLTLSTGHSGFLGSLHAKSGREALWRLEMLIQMGAPQWSKDTIRNLIRFSLDSIVVLEVHNGKRRIKEVTRLSGLESHGFLLEMEYQVDELDSHVQIGARRHII